LVVDDDEVIRKMVGACLQTWGCIVLLTESGEQALETFKAYDGTIPVMLTDIVMSGMSGIELGDRLSQISPSLRIVFMSGYVGASHLGGCRVLRKPFQLQELKETIEAAHGQPNMDSA